MKKRITKSSEGSRAVYSELEGYARRKVQEFIQALLEEEVTEFLGRSKSERNPQAVDGVRGYRNGYGKPRQLVLSSGTLTLRDGRECGTARRNSRARYYRCLSGGAQKWDSCCRSCICMGWRKATLSWH